MLFQIISSSIAITVDNLTYTRGYEVKLYSDNVITDWNVGIHAESLDII